MTKYPLPDLGLLARELELGAPGLALGGVVPSARSLALAAMATSGWPQKLALIVVPHVAEAEDLAAGLRLLAPELRVGVVPAELSGPYLGAEPPLAARLDTVELLRKVGNREIDVVVAPARVLGSRLPLPEALAHSSFSIESEDQLDARQLATRLTTAGYRRVDLVEEVGEFAVRGWVVDIHPGGDAGFRLQLDDDRVESIRRFDPETQRSSPESAPAITVVPLDPFPVVAGRVADVAALLETEFPALAAQMTAGAERRLWWGTLHLADESTSWLDLAQQIIVCDRDEVMGEIGRWWQVQNREWETVSRRTMDLPPPDRLLRGPEELRPAIEAAALRLERLELVDGATTWRRLSTHPAESFVRKLPELVPTLRSRRAQDMVQVLVVASPGEGRRFVHLLREGEVEPVEAPPPPGSVAIAEGGLQHGFVWEGRLAVYGRRDLTVGPGAAPPPSGFGSLCFRSSRSPCRRSGRPHGPWNRTIHWVPPGRSGGPGDRNARPGVRRR